MLKRQNEEDQTSQEDTPIDKPEGKKIKSESEVPVAPTAVNGSSSLVNFIKLNNPDFWQTEGFQLWANLSENGFAFVDVDFNPSLRVQDVSGSANDLREHVNYGPLIGLKKGQGWMSYYHRRGGEQSSIPEFKDTALKVQLDTHFDRLLNVSTELFRHLCGSRANVHQVRFSDAKKIALKSIITQIMKVGENLGEDIPESTKQELLRLFNASKSIKKNLKYYVPNCNLEMETDPNLILCNYPMHDDQIAPDYFQITSYCDAELSSYTDPGLLTLIFCSSNRSNGEGLEILSKNNWINVERELRLHPHGYRCVVVPGYQLEVLTKGKIKAPRRRVAKSVSVAVSFSLQARNDAIINGKNIDFINQEWSTLHLPTSEKAGIEL